MGWACGVCPCRPISSGAESLSLVTATPPVLRAAGQAEELCMGKGSSQHHGPAPCCWVASHDAVTFQGNVTNEGGMTGLNVVSSLAAGQ